MTKPESCLSNSMVHFQRFSPSSDGCSGSAPPVGEKWQCCAHWANKRREKWQWNPFSQFLLMFSLCKDIVVFALAFDPVFRHYWWWVHLCILNMFVLPSFFFTCASVIFNSDFFFFFVTFNLQGWYFQASAVSDPTARFPKTPLFSAGKKRKEKLSVEPAAAGRSVLLISVDVCCSCICSLLIFFMNYSCFILMYDCLKSLFSELNNADLVFSNTSSGGAADHPGTARTVAEAWISNTVHSSPPFVASLLGSVVDGHCESTPRLCRALHCCAPCGLGTQWREVDPPPFPSSLLPSVLHTPCFHLVLLLLRMWVRGSEARTRGGRLIPCLPPPAPLVPADETIRKSRSYVFTLHTRLQLMFVQIFSGLVKCI